MRLRLLPELPAASGPLLGAAVDEVMAQRLDEADQFYASVTGVCHTPDTCRVQRQDLAGLLWSKQFYHYDVSHWLKFGFQGRPGPVRSLRRNAAWTHLYNEDVISIPDKWEYPWYASWDLAFPCIPLALVERGLRQG